MKYSNITQAVFRRRSVSDGAWLSRKEVRPNLDTHAEFGAALEESKAAGVEVIFLSCHVEVDSLEIKDIYK